MFWVKKNLYFRIHFFFFLLLILWMAFRIVFDLNDLEYLKQLTVATTGGILLFYIIGASLGLTRHCLVSLRSDIKIEKYIILLFCFLSF
ncbi:hypothetical protein O1D34_002176, partial [Vibrio cholerae]|nr:hypothetical protein [Vibrio cholerae]